MLHYFLLLSYICNCMVPLHHGGNDEIFNLHWKYLSNFQLVLTNFLLAYSHSIKQDINFFPTTMYLKV
ncbi:hypothetical protein KC19_8G009500 [Ceratodon purpureus]|uniref:Uncharacterized protein n=1 Tax=Ceratodon purpureus TaxID=3225 RepID=A0A8T0H235_CERPU|nr:hypothetical protein KC19_8G009500 [Ceratodon purpureus]